MFKSIKTRLIVLFLLLAFLPLFALRLVAYPKALEALQQGAVKNLENIGRKQAEIVALWMRERVRDVRVTAMNPLVIQGTHISPSDKEFLLLSALLNNIKEAYGYKETIISDVLGQVRVSTSEHRWGKNIFQSEGFRRALEGQAFISKVIPREEKNPEREVPCMFFSSPITSGNKVLGVLIFEMELHSINALMKGISLGKSCETYLIDEQGITLTELKHVPRGQGSIGLRIANPRSNMLTLAAYKCQKGGEGSDARGYLNYAGQEVFGFWRWIPEFKLGVIAEITRQEALGMAYALEGLVANIFLVLGLFITVGAFLLGRKISTPILRLTELTRKMSRGDLTQAAEITTGDEVGELAQSFNQMVGSIRDKTIRQKALEEELQRYTSTLEKMVEDRTQALRATEERYRSLFEASKDAVFICDREDRFLDINQAGVELFGYPYKEEVLSKNFVNLYANPDDRSTFREAMDKAGFIKDFELELKKKDGTRLTVLMTCDLRTDEKGTVIGYEGIIRDVTEEKRREREKDIVTNISKFTASSLELKEVYKAVSLELGRLIDFDRTSITLPVDTSSVLEYIVFTKDSPSSSLSEGITFPVLGSTTEAVIRSGEPIIVQDTAQGRFSTDPILYSEGIRSRLNFPLEYKGKIIGALNFGSRKVDNFTEAHVELLRQVAPLLAIAIENSNLFCKIRDSEEKYRDLIENAPEMIHLLDAQGRFLNVNKTELQRLGYGLEEALRMRLEDIVPEEDRQGVMRHLQRVIDTGHDRAECVFLTKAGERVIVEMDSTGLRDPSSGSFIHTRSFIRDITERKKAEEEVLRLAHTLRNIGECSVIADLEGRISFVNKAFEKVLGYPHEEVLGRDISMLGSPNSPGDWKNEILKKTYSQGEWEGELLLRKKNEEEFPVYLFTSLIRDEKNEPLALAAAFRDIAEHKRLQMELFQSEKMAAIGQLAAGVAHEIRNPLSIIGSSIYYMKDVLKNQDKNIKEHMRIIQEEIQRCQRIINQLLDFSRKAKTELEECELNKLVDDTLSLVGKELLVNNIQVVKDFRHLPSVRLNIDDIKQALLNLILNARDAMPRGGTLSISTRANSNGNVYIHISDTGCGIAQKELKKIFLPFYTTKETGSGTGLGLYSVHSAVKRAKGTIKVESQEGKGSTFTIVLPYKEAGDGRQQA